MRLLDARKKFCPHIQKNCIGEHCMAWHDITNLFINTNNQHKIKIEDKKGYCVLFHKKEHK